MCTREDVSFYSSGTKRGGGEKAEKFKCTLEKPWAIPAGTQQRECLQLLPCPLIAIPTSRQEEPLRILFIQPGTSQGLQLSKPWCFALNSQSFAELGTFHSKWIQWRAGQARLKSLVIAPENTSTDFLNEILNGNRLFEFKLNPLIGNQIITIKKILFSVLFYWVFLKNQSQENSNAPK